MYNSSGFQVLAFPCNQFGGQAPGTDECERNYTYRRMQLPFNAPNFTIFDKAVVNGPGSLKLFNFLKQAAPKESPFDMCGECDIAWNYEKFLVNASGYPVRRYPSGISPLVAEMAIRELLNVSELKSPQEAGFPKLYPSEAVAAVATEEAEATHALSAAAATGAAAATAAGKATSSSDTKEESFAAAKTRGEGASASPVGASA